MLTISYFQSELSATWALQQFKALLTARPIRLIADPTRSPIFWTCSELGDWQETDRRWVELSRIVRVISAYVCIHSYDLLRGLK